MVDRGGLENRYGSRTHRGFEPHSLRHKKCRVITAFLIPAAVGLIGFLSSRGAKRRGDHYPDTVILNAVKDLIFTE